MDIEVIENLKSETNNILLTVALAGTFAASGLTQTWFNGYERKNGTHVDGRYRSSPSGTTSDNWSTKVITIPIQGKKGIDNKTFRNSAIKLYSFS